MPDDARDRLIANLARLLAGLAVPVSMQMPLGAATAAWSELHGQLIRFGWASADDYETALRDVLTPDDDGEAERIAEVFADARAELDRGL